jgi:hypothetical protein
MFYQCSTLEWQERSMVAFVKDKRGQRHDIWRTRTGGTGHGGTVNRMRK